MINSEITNNNVTEFGGSTENMESTYEKKLKIKNSRFGEIDFEEKQIVTFPDGILGFEELKRFGVITIEEYKPFQWLTSLDDPELVFPIISPVFVSSIYSPELNRNDMETLKATNPDELAIFTIVTFGEDIKEATVNLKGPVLINAKKRLGKQMILNSDDYPTRQLLFSSSK